MVRVAAKTRTQPAHPYRLPLVWGTGGGYRRLHRAVGASLGKKEAYEIFIQTKVLPARRMIGFRVD